MAELTYETIADEIIAFCNEHSIEPLIARQRGSHKLGVPHNNSDIDVMIIYLNEPAAYATLGGPVETIYEKRLDGELDIAAWDYTKFAKEAMRSDPNATEFALSEKEYLDVPKGWYDIDAMIAGHVNLMSLYHHYLGMAKANYKKYIESGNDPSVNRHFHVLRPVACARYIREMDMLPPLDIYRLTATSPLADTALGQDLRRFGDMKSNGLGGREMADLSGFHLQMEIDAEMEPTDIRTKSPKAHTFDNFITQRLK